MKKYGIEKFPYCTINEKCAEDVRYTEHFWRVNDALCHPVRWESMFFLFFLPDRGILKMGSQPRYQCYVSDHVCRLLYLSEFCTFQHNKRQTSTFAVKEDIIRHIENGRKRSTVADKLKVPRGMLSTLPQNKSDIKKNTAEKAHSTSWRARLPAYDGVERSVYLLFCVRSAVVSRPMLHKKARNFACILGALNFTASSDWLDRSKMPYNIVWRAACGESEATDIEDVNKWIAEQWPGVTARYQPWNIYNANETALFW